MIYLRVNNKANKSRKENYVSRYPKKNEPLQVYVSCSLMIIVGFNVKVARISLKMVLIAAILKAKERGIEMMRQMLSK